MNLQMAATMAISLLILNAAVFFILKKYLLGRQDAGLKFLLINLPKDLAWSVFWLMNIEKTKANFFVFIVILLAGIFGIYYKGVRAINKS